MKKKEWPYWLKGGLFGLALELVVIIIATVYSIIEYGVSLLTWEYILTGLMELIFYAIISSIILSIYGRIKSR